MRMLLLLALMARLCPFARADGTSATLPELSTQAFVGTQLFGPQHDEEWVKQCLNLNLDKKFGCRIIAYRIRWFSGRWSSWFVPGVNDLYKKDGEPLRRFWACFNDHGFEILYMADAKVNFPQASTAAPDQDVGIVNLAVMERPDALRKPAAAPGGAPMGEALRLESPWGFRSLDYLFNRDRWAEVPKTGESRFSGSVPVGLDQPRQIILLHNAWSLPMAGGQDDIRLADLRKHVLRPSLDFVPDWPAYSLPGYIVAVHKRDDQWALIASLGEYYLIEEGGTVGLLRSDHP
jgi:hypothetical protein